MSGSGQEHPAGTGIALVRAALNKAASFHAIDQPTNRDLGKIEIGRQRGLRHTVTARQERQHPPQRTGNAKRLERAIDNDPAQARDIMNEEAETKVGIEIFLHRRNSEKGFRPTIAVGSDCK